MNYPPPDVLVSVVRRVDDHQIEYVRECYDFELDGVLASEENEAGKILAMDVVPA